VAAWTAAEEGGRAPDQSDGGVGAAIRVERPRGGVAPMVQPQSRAMCAVMDALGRASQEPAAPVLLCGPPGVGKRHAARLLHGLGAAGRLSLPAFVELDGAQLGESAADGLGRAWELARGGTLYLDELAALPPPAQETLLGLVGRVRAAAAPEREELPRLVVATRLGGARAAVDPRLHRALASCVLRIPSLVERSEDIAALAGAFAHAMAARLRKPVLGLSAQALAVLLTHDYPGEVLELRNIVEHAVMLARGPLVTEHDLVVPPRDARADGAFFAVQLGPLGHLPSLEWVEGQYLVRVLRHCGGVRTRAAQALGISYPTLLKRLRELGLA
jgi:DNA-binding NtrC family response regulator